MYEPCIKKYYEVICYKCGEIINIYTGDKPTTKQLRKDCGSVVINNGKIITICANCNK